MYRRDSRLVLPVAAVLVVAVALCARLDRPAGDSHAPAPESSALAKDTQVEEPKHCRESFARVVKGMTLEQAAAVVGAPPGVYIHGELGRDVVLSPRGLGWTDYVQWVADDAELLVLFTDERGHPILPKTVRGDDRIVEVHLWDVMNFKR